ncbi:DNA ligase D [Pseudacidovorax sp. RU35E]|uniref:DNA ligase D n=1 Tax=Pseudacidovorax sp. RU35E TaxID=1907403 RepID=UPI000954AA00|nr:DNA ligase D [Pseudacidovorax sp. RU35E]SIR55797.1 ATP-dependent DNA ligase LigD phosphoesterase module /ATP-dependent DNA ligase LigD polymerase module [Pseudacidovorax sp. RU35E]
MTVARKTARKASSKATRTPTRRTSAPRAGDAPSAGTDAAQALADYHRKRDFQRTPEPRHGGAPGVEALAFVVQKHDATRLHYDFRLELDGTLKSWAVPKGPCLDPAVKRMAVEVEDHPIAYGDFEGRIPEGQYGAGTVIVWDRGTWVPEGDARAGLRAGKLSFTLQGHKLQGRWTLVRMHGRDEKKPSWLIIKDEDAAARPLADYDVTEAEPDSVRHIGQPEADTADAPAEPDPPAASEPAVRGRSKAATQRPDGAARKGKPKGAENASLPGVAAALPDTLAPQLAVLADGPPPEPAQWAWELKFDGYRLLTRIDGRGRVRCFTRNGHDWTDRLPELARALAKLPVRNAWLDGEIGVLGANDAPDFQALQNAFDLQATAPIVYWLFDAPFVGGRDLRDEPLSLRREALRAIFDAGELPPSLRFSEAFDAAPRDLLASAAGLGFEGVVGKRLDSPYLSGRSPAWIKLKHQLRQEFVIGGYTAPRGSRSGFGALLLGVYDEQGELKHAGNVGTGFDQRRLAEMHAQLQALEQDDCPFTPRPAGEKAQWVRPELVAEVAFGQWTREGKVRQAVFQGLRSDKPARQIVREHAMDSSTAAHAAGRQRGRKPATPSKESHDDALPGDLRVTHADRVIDRASGATKGEVIAYYAQVAPLMLPHLRGRPVSLVRAPDGVGGELFFQKHVQNAPLPGVRLLDPALDPGHEPLLQIDSAKGLLSAAQMNTLEFHTWNGHSRGLDKPDRMTFDLDPGEGVAWAHVQEGALLMRTLLDELGLQALLKTSGGKGLHVVVPIRRQHGWDTVKDFSRAVVQHLARTLPERFVAKSGPKNRVGRIFVDYLRNGFGATTVSAWSVRSRPGLGVSVPVAWDELPNLTSGAHWTLASIGERLATGNTPWDEAGVPSQGLARAMQVLGFSP